MEVRVIIREDVRVMSSLDMLFVVGLIGKRKYG